jgi:hypothetical protein
MGLRTRSPCISLVKSIAIATASVYVTNPSYEGNTLV